MNYQELHKAVADKKVVSATTKDGRKIRLFNASNGAFCYFPKGRSRSGYTVSYAMFDTFVKFQYAKTLTEDEKSVKGDKKLYNKIAKYRRMAYEAVGFTNSWIEACKKLPKTFQEWVDGDKKGLYELDITTGNSTDGVVISIERITKQYKYIGDKLKKAIAEQISDTICNRVEFAGYEMSISTQKHEDGTFQCSLSLEYKDCLNGYYYLLINQGNFIGYDKD